MSPGLVPPDHLAEWRAQRPSLFADLADALLEIRADGTHVYDQDHPAWSAAVKQASAPRGVGDTVAKVAAAIGFPICDGCNARREALNRWFPYRRRSWRR